MNFRWYKIAETALVFSCFGTGGSDHLPWGSLAKYFWDCQPYERGAEEFSCSNTYRGASHRRVSYIWVFEILFLRRWMIYNWAHRWIFCQKIWFFPRSAKKLWITFPIFFTFRSGKFFEIALFWGNIVIIIFWGKNCKNLQI